MGKTNLGRVSVTPRGAYNNETSYKRLDVVEYEGSSYLFLKDSTGIIPTADGEVTMLLAKRGKDFAYEDFTPEQLAALKGADGNNGVNGSDGTKGDKGDPGKGLTILGYLDTPDLLNSVSFPNPGDAYGVGTAAPYDIYVFDGVSNDWVNNGMLSGGGGEGGGNVVLIPFAITGLTAESTSEEIFTAWGGKENLTNVCKQLSDNKAIAKMYYEEETESMSYVILIANVRYTDNNNLFISAFVGAGFISIQITTTVSNGVASYDQINMNAVEQIRLSDAIFNLTSESTSGQVLSAFGGIVNINDIYNKIAASGRPNSLLIAGNENSLNGCSVLHNFGGSNIAENGFYRQLYFAYTSIEPTIEVIKWVIKFNNTSAVCEVTRKEVGGASSEANIVFIPFGVMSLNSTSTSNDIIEAFGGRTALNSVIDNLKAGDAITFIVGQGTNISCTIVISPDADYNNFELYIETYGEGVMVVSGIASQDGELQINSSGVSALLLQTNLISDPSVGGADKPASAEAVKVVNDKIGWTPDPDSTEEQICTGEFFTDFTGTKKQVYYKSRRVSGKFSAMADGYYSWNASIIPASYTALSATGLAEILGANNVKVPIMIGVDGYPNSTAHINTGWLSVISKPSFQISTEVVCNAVCNIKYIKP